MIRKKDSLHPETKSVVLELKIAIPGVLKTLNSQSLWGLHSLDQLGPLDPQYIFGASKPNIVSQK